MQEIEEFDNRLYEKVDLLGAHDSSFEVQDIHFAIMRWPTFVLISSIRQINRQVKILYE